MGVALENVAIDFDNENGGGAEKGDGKEGKLKVSKSEKKRISEGESSEKKKKKRVMGSSEEDFIAQKVFDEMLKRKSATMSSIIIMRGKGETRGRAALVVLGDIGRSPRMQYHALSLARQASLEVDIVAFGAQKPSLSLGINYENMEMISGECGIEEPVHILAYYSSCGLARPEKLEKFLADIRDGRYLRAKNMVAKLNKLKLPLKLDHVAKIAGSGVAPGLAYSAGSEPDIEEAVRLIRETGGVAVLAHPWALKNPVAIIKRFKEAGLHGIEVYRRDENWQENQLAKCTNSATKYHF
ncbi:hypothetical protein AgCh_034071 [Apium graveolens]